MGVRAWLKQVGGLPFEEKTVEVSAGAADGSKIPNTNAAGYLDPSLLNATAAPSGAASAGKVALFDSSGRLSPSAMPVGVAADAATMTASEAIPAGGYVNIWNSSGPKVRCADAPAGRPAHGFSPSAIASGASGLIYFEGTNTGVTGRTPGATQFLGAAGVGAETPPAATSTSSIVQQLGTAIDVTAVSFEPHQPITLAYP